MTGVGVVAINNTTVKNQKPVNRTPPPEDKTGLEEKHGKAAGTAGNPEEFDRTIAEANALGLYVARHGNSLLGDEKELYNNLLKAISDATSSCSMPHWRALMAAYAKITAVTYKEQGVNGRTILDTQTKILTLEKLYAPRNLPVVIGGAIFLFALIIEVLVNWSARISDPSTLTGIKAVGYHLIGALSIFLVPAAWGGIGACVFLMKRISDKLFELAYEESRMCGAGTRIFLGAMLGVASVALVFPNFEDQIQLGGGRPGAKVDGFYRRPCRGTGLCGLRIPERSAGAFL